MVSLNRTNRAVRVDVFSFPALVALPLERAMCLHEVVVPAILTGALEFAEGGRRGVSPCSRALAIIRALGGDKGDSRFGGIG